MRLNADLAQFFAGAWAHQRSTKTVAALVSWCRQQGVIAGLKIVVAALQYSNLERVVLNLSIEEAKHSLAK